MGGTGLDSVGRCSSRKPYEEPHASKAANSLSPYGLVLMGTSLNALWASFLIVDS